MFVMVSFGIVGWAMKKLEFEGAPLILAFLLSPMVEESLRQSLLISDGSFMIFITHPISTICLLVALILVLTTLVPSIAKRRESLGKSSAKEI
jgi:putative tricarboxylic transport membrane protein